LALLSMPSPPFLPLWRLRGAPRARPSHHTSTVRCGWLLKGAFGDDALDQLGGPWSGHDRHPQRRRADAGANYRGVRRACLILGGPEDPGCYEQVRSKRHGRPFTPSGSKRLHAETIGSGDPHPTGRRGALLVPVLSRNSASHWSCLTRSREMPSSAASSVSVGGSPSSRP
jgi:hypothetical protein